MTSNELRQIRIKWGFTQDALASRMGMRRRAYISLEIGERPLKKSHELVLERISIDLAVERGDRHLIIQSLRCAVDNLLKMEE